MDDLQRVLELALRSGASAADVYAIESDETPVGFEANRLKSLETKNSRGFGLRVIREGRLGVASATDLGDPQFLVDAALEVSAYGATAAFELPAPATPTTVDIFDAAVGLVPVETMVRLGRELVERVGALNPELQVDAGVSKNRVRTRILTSAGQSVEYEKSVYAVSVQGTLIRGTDMLFVGEGDVSCAVIGDIDWIVEEVRRQLTNAERTASIGSGTYPVLFTHHGVAYALAGALTSAFNGRTVLQGASPLVGKLGETLADERITLIDEPTAPLQPASSPVDDEGVPTRRRALIERGRIAGFSYDLQTAGLAGAEPTGNGGRSPGTLPTPSLHALVLENGDRSVAELLAGVDEGLVVELVIGAGQGNVLGGDFGGNVVLGYKVERGEIVGRVKDTMIAGNVWEALRHVGGLGNDGRWVGGGLYTPSLLVEGLSVSSSGG